jgi:hypothetical protein
MTARRVLEAGGLVWAFVRWGIAATVNVLAAIPVFSTVRRVAVMLIPFFGTDFSGLRWTLVAEGIGRPEV